MKATKLLLALAVPAAFAACSQDEFVNDMQKVNDGRPVVGAIGLDIPEEAQTRWGWGSATGFTFDENDYIGAALMDTYLAPGGISPTWEQKYQVVDYISTNYKYGYKDGWTNNDAVMSEGNYFFYMPYNENLKGRAGLTYSIPVDQFAYDETAASPVAEETRSWKKNQMFIGYDDVTVNDQAAKPQMVEFFAKPRFNVNYIGSNGTKVERIVMRDKTDKFVVKGKLTPAQDLGVEYNPVNPAVAKYAVASDKNLADAFVQYNKAVTEHSLTGEQKFVNPLTVATQAVDVVKESEDISLNFAPATKVTGLMVVPAGTHTLHTANHLEFDIYTDKGLVTLEASTIAATGELAEAAAGTELTYKNIDKLTEIKAGDGVKANAVTINFGDKEVKVPAEVSVSTTAQLESIMRWYKDASVVTTSAALAAADGVLTVKLIGNNVELSSKVYEIIKDNEALTVKFEGSLTIASDLASDAIMLVSKESTGTVTVKNEQNLAYTSAAATVSYDIYVAAGGTLNINANSSASKKTTLKNVTNAGTLTFQGGVVAATKVTNWKDMTVAAGAVVSSVVENKATYTASTLQYAQDATLTNKGQLTMGAASLNESVIYNDSKLTVAGAFENKYVAPVDRGTNGYTGKIYNENATTSYIYSDGTGALTNSAYIDNVGAIYSKNGGSITNVGIIDAKDGATTYVTTNTNGEVRLESRDTETQVNGSNKGIISYTMTAADLKNGVFAFDTASDKFNTLNVSMNVTFEDGKTAPENLVLEGSGNLTVNCKTWVDPEGSLPNSVAAFNSITARDGNRYIIKGTKVTAKKLTIAGNTVLQIPALSSFGVFANEKPNSVAEASAIVKINGELLVGGQFYANFQGFQPNGTKSSAGDGSYHWNSKNDWDDDTAIEELAATLSAGTLKVVGNKTVTSVTGAAILIGDGKVVVKANQESTLSANKLKVNSAAVEIQLGEQDDVWKEDEVSAVTSYITSALEGVTVNVYYTKDGNKYLRTFEMGATDWIVGTPKTVE